MTCKTPIIGFLLHKWGKWEQYAVTYQERRCEVCGRYQVSSTAA